MKEKAQRSPGAQEPGRKLPAAPDISPGAKPQNSNTDRQPRHDELPMPHERDEAPEVPPGPGEKGPRQVIDQAASDISRGLLDSERRGIPSDVPGPGIAPEHSPGAEVPREGVDAAGYTRKETDPKGSKPPKP